MLLNTADVAVFTTGLLSVPLKSSLQYLKLSFQLCDHLSSIKLHLLVLETEFSSSFSPHALKLQHSKGSHIEDVAEHTHQQ